MNNQTLQTTLTILLVALAAGWLLWRAWRKRKNPGCGNDCGCPATKFKKQLKQNPHQQP